MHHGEQDDPQSRKRMKDNLERIQHRILVMSGKGGVGKSTVSVNMAYALALQGKRVGILDADIHGPSVAKMTGVEGRKMESGPGGFPVPIQAVNNLHVLSIAFLLENPDDPVIWRGPMKSGFIKQCLDSIEWPELDYLVIDCPPGTGDEALSVLHNLGSIDGVVIVTTPQDVALLDVRKSISFVNRTGNKVIGVVENMSGFICSHCGERTDIFKRGGADSLVLEYGITLLGTIPLSEQIAHSGDDGKPFVYYYSKTPAGEEMNSVVSRLMDIVG